MRKDATLRASLLAWYDANKRDLPWRRTRDPYRVWVSEIMLQQTRVETVIAYYERFLKHFPTLKALAAASEDDVLAQWSGLGYYRRARLLHKGVREAVASYGASVPRDAEARRSLAGVGRYTSGAIGSIAFDLPEALVDGNVARVLSRLDGLRATVGSKESDSALWSRAESLVRGERPGDFNQALMELGATVCTPRSPSCARCPWKKNCVAQKSGEPESYPQARVKKASPHIELVAIAIVNSLDETHFIRGKEALFGGLWGLPMREGAGISVARDLLASLDVVATLQPRPLGVVEHVLTHRRLSITLYRANVAIENARSSSFFSATARENLGRSSLTEKLLALVFPDQLSLPLRERARIQKKTDKPKKSSPKVRTKKRDKAQGRGSAS